MKMVTAIIKPFKLDDVMEALVAAGVQGVTVTEVRGYGHQKGEPEMYRGSEQEVRFLSRLKIEIATPEDKADKLIEAIKASAVTGRVGDGKIFVYDIDNVVRIRNGETGADAL